MLTLLYKLVGVMLLKADACMHSQEEVNAIEADLGNAGAMRHTTVVSAPSSCGLGQRYAALCSALAIAEKVRDQGGHSFVVLDDISCMVRLWLS